MTSLRLTVRLFAAFRERAGASELPVELADGATVGDVVAAVGVLSPALAALLVAARPVVNQEFAGADQVIQAGDEIALLPPLSGGAE